MSGYTDIHAHFVYGVDDGARTKRDMEAMLDAAYEDGITTLLATPHVTPGIEPFDWQLFLRRLNEARAYCRQLGYAMRLHSGAEVMFTPAAERFIREKRLYTLAESEDALVEFVPDISFTEMEDAISLLERSGYNTIIAHAERYVCLFKRHNARYLKGHHDVRFQMNCNTVLNKRGFFRRRRIESWLREGIIDFIASDAHDVKIRPFRMKAAHRALRESLDDYEADRVMGI